MSTNLYVSFIPKKEEQYPVLFNRLLSWVKKKGEDIEIEEILDSSDFTKYKIQEIDPEKIIKSNLINSVGFTYKKLKPYELLVSLYLVGSKRYMGHYSKENGNIYLSICERSIWGWYLRHYLEREEYEKIIEHKVNVLIGLSDLFHEWISLSEGLIKQASFFKEDELRSRVTSFIGYYSNFKDFVIDFTRIVLDSKSNYYFTEYHGKEEEFVKLIGDDIRDKHFYNNFKDNDRGYLLNFINRLDINALELLKNLKSEVIEKKLMSVLKNNNDFIFNKTNQGFIICTYPDNSLWTIYYDFFEEINIGYGAEV